ncbi:LytTR family DNA-binding domain-containing protein [Fulvivirgaceae bacterium BMA10]|uniref:LytTR family DNA-binding domain-containing protein n=1 Tax=Splendidivirga corallicola TaxID=3051826 RepID=A0ABT8KWV8_9BACT|nr:LytTR family DNA-binding domain-containing protein [Fulvivirgaceae bacterium BMA10]
MKASSIRSWLNSEAHYFSGKKELWWFIILTGVFMTLFLIYFQPYGVNNYDPNETIDLEFVIAISLFGLVTMLTLIFNEFLMRPLFLKNTTRKGMLLWLCWSLLLMSTVIYFFYNYLGNWHDMSWKSYLEFIWNISVLGIFPVGGLMIYFHMRSLKSNLYEITSLQRDTSNPDKLVLITAENEKDKIALTLRHLLYLESEDNYVAIHFMEGDQVKKRLVRSTLKRLEQELSETKIFRCHRSFMINLFQVDKVEGNQHKLKVKLKSIEGTIPVSKNYVSTVLTELDAQISPTIVKEQA